MNAHATAAHQEQIITLCHQDDEVQLKQYLDFLLASWTPFRETFNFFWIDFMSLHAHNPLMTAVYNHSNKVVKFLVETCGAAPNQRIYHPNGTTALHVAAYTKNLEALTCILNKSAEYFPNIVQEQDKWGKTALHHAYYHGFDEGVKKLLEAGSDPDVPDRWGNKPIDLHESNRKN